MKVNIYYGGRGLIEDSTIYVIQKMTEVLNELRVEVVRYNLYEEKNAITTLPKTLKEADGIILATNLEWWGIGGNMQQFLDACWLYGDKEWIRKLYMMPIVISNTYGEKEAMVSLTKAWEILGGLVCEGFCGYVSDHVEFETNLSYKKYIEKKAEALYRSVNQKIVMLPSSDNLVSQMGMRNSGIELTPQESEQLSMYVSDETYVKKQKEDIEELASMFKKMLGSEDDTEAIVSRLKSHYVPVAEVEGSFEFYIKDLNKAFAIHIKDRNIESSMGEQPLADVRIKIKNSTLEDIMKGTTSLQKAFMTGDVTAKGDFKLLNNFDRVFQF